MFAHLSTVRDLVTEGARDLDPSAMDPVEVRATVTEIAAVERLLAGARVRLEGRLEADRPTATWLAEATGRSVGAAERELATAEALADLPATDRAARDGELSADQVSAVVFGASADPSAEADLLATARRGSLSELRRRARKVRGAATDDDTKHRDAHAGRDLSSGVDVDLGVGRLNAHGTTTSIAEMLSLLEPWTQAEFDRARRDGRTERRGAYAYDALLAALRHAAGITPAHDHDLTTVLTPHGGRPGGHSSAARDRGPDSGSSGNGPDGRDGGTVSGPDSSSGSSIDRRSDTGGGEGDLDPGADRRAGPRPGPGAGPGTLPPSVAHPATSGAELRSGGPRRRRPPRLLVRVDLTALLRGRSVGGETCEIDGIGPVPVAALRELLPGAVIDLIVSRGEDAFNVTHLGRYANATQQAVLDWLGGECSRLGCGATRHLQIDHRIPWATVKVTELANLDRLCTPDHRLKTTEGWELVPGTGKRPMVPPDHPDHPRNAAARANAPPGEAAA